MTTAPLGVDGRWIVMTAVSLSKVPSPFGALPLGQRSTDTGSGPGFFGAPSSGQRPGSRVMLKTKTTNFMRSLGSTQTLGSKEAPCLRPFALGPSRRIPADHFREGNLYRLVGRSTSCGSLFRWRRGLPPLLARIRNRRSEETAGCLSPHHRLGGHAASPPPSEGAHYKMYILL